jgi:hypothetical protein
MLAVTTVAQAVRDGPARHADRRPVEERPAVRRPSVRPLPGPSRSLLQRCGAGPCDCATPEEGEVLRKPAEPGLTDPGIVPPIVHEVLKSQGIPLNTDARAFFEPRFGQDFSMVRLHTGTRAAASARALSARGYTVGSDIVLGEDAQWVPAAQGGHVLAHELAHVVQQQGGGGAQAKLTVGKASSPAEHEADLAAEYVMNHSAQAETADQVTRLSRRGDSHLAGLIERACLSGAVCGGPPGSSTKFGTDVDTAEAAARRRRAAMSPARQGLHGHAGHARALEKFLNGQAPGLLPNLHGIFVDQDMDPGVGATTEDCASMVPPITGASKQCTFVHGELNQQAETFNTDPKAMVIGGVARESWRISTLQILTHEVQHVLFDTAFSGKPVPGGVTSCTRNAIAGELSELNAIISEFPSAFDAVPSGAAASDPSVQRLARWFDSNIDNPSESIKGTLTTIRCKCDCGDADKFVRETFNFAASSWSAAQKDAFNAELRKPARALHWPL